MSFRSLIAWITNELTVLLNLGEQIQPDSTVNEFSLELSSFLKELPCPYPALISGPIASRYAAVDSRLTLLNYLMCELMAAKMCHTLKPEKQVVIEIVSYSRPLEDHPNLTDFVELLLAAGKSCGCRTQIDYTKFKSRQTTAKYFTECIF